MENAEIIISLVVSLSAAVSGLIATIVKLIPTLKALVKEKNWKKITEAALSAAIEAEKSMRSGEEKKQIVLDSVSEFCGKIGVEFDSEAISAFIDTAITFSNGIQGK